MIRVVDPIASLPRLERTLLRISKEHGSTPFVVAVTAISVVLSVTITLALLVLTGSRGVEIVIGLAMAAGVPSVVAPAAASMLARLLHALDTATDELHHLARTDPLTGALNRRAFAGEAETVAAMVGDRRLLVAMVDVDDFKGVNDVHGHGAGDRVLVELAARLGTVVGSDGRVARFGGDEFVVCAAVEPGLVGDVEADLQRACDLGTVAPGAAASIGVHVARPGEPLTESMARADHALYGEKRSRGRTPDGDGVTRLDELSRRTLASLTGVNYSASAAADQVGWVDDPRVGTVRHG